MELHTFMNKLIKSPEEIEFTETMAVIESNYQFSETAFTNGEVSNQKGENSGSCKLFAFAQKQGLSEQQTLACFGSYYRDDVVSNPNGVDHQNIRHFIKTGWQGIYFDADALRAK